MSNSAKESGKDRPPSKDNSELEDDETELHPFMEVTGLDVDIWPAWGPLPSRNVFFPLFSTHVRDDDKKHSFVTTLTFAELIEVCSQFAHVLKISGLAAQDMGPMKLQVFRTKEELIEDIDQICADLGAVLKVLKEKDILAVEGPTKSGTKGDKD
ncbi:hypothetical protein ACQR13_17725 [Bradyrhizobium sp. HKCCYLRH3059]|uniref:hypothetical protein n=1 Tax=Bradyrhizobium sp. HKCCYLRH3059 TaxID=3420745 RepID=UPI003EBACA92